jgi:hypothetical protein
MALHIPPNSVTQRLGCPEKRCNVYNGFTSNYGPIGTVNIWLLEVTKYLCHKWPRICSVCYNCIAVLFSFMTYDRLCNKSNMLGANSERETADPSGTHEFTPVFSRVFVARSLVVCVVFCRSLYVIRSLCFWPLCCLHVFRWLLLKTSLASLNFSYIYLYAVRSCIYINIYIKVVNSIQIHGGVFSDRPCKIKYIINLWQVGTFPPLPKLIVAI